MKSGKIDKNQNKNYKVSLAIKVYSNFETVEMAKNEKEAIDKAVEKYESGEYEAEDITEPDWANSELDISLGRKMSGIYVEQKH